MTVSLAAIVILAGGRRAEPVHSEFKGASGGISLRSYAPSDGQVSSEPSGHKNRKRKIPVILDTDIGDDIDDTWALGMVLRCPDFDVKLVVGDHGKPLYRAALIAKFLETVGRTDVAVRIGLDVEIHHTHRNQGQWVRDYSLAKYPGPVYLDGLQAIIDTIMDSSGPVTVIAVGPLPNIAAALQREPQIARKARFVGMHGSVRRGYGGKKEIDAEYNVRANPRACQTVFTAPWEMTITPLDTCGIVSLRGGKYEKVRDSKDPVAAAVIENYRIWCKGNSHQPDSKSSVLFDTVAVYLAHSTDFVQIENLNIRVTDDGYTRIDPAARSLKVATEWKDLAAFEDLLVAWLTR